VPLDGALIVFSGQRAPMRLSWKELEAYAGTRATRGSLLPRGWQKIDGLSVEES
jgi:topoisomerase-4 subunit A